MEKPSRSFWQLWSMSFGFLGIQFGWGLQMANMSAIYEYLGAKPEQIPMLWLAAPLTGLLVQPVIGYLSDRTWCWLGRRRPYFVTGTIMACLSLVLMPFSHALWMAAMLLWVLDFSVNVSMEPFRAFVADLLPESQRGQGFAMQSLLIGLGAILASALPWLLTHVFGVSSGHSEGSIPLTVRYAFHIGAAVYFAAVMWTVATTKEYPPEDMEAFRRMKAERRGLGAGARELFEDFRRMPSVMRQLAGVQFFTWLGLFCMWLYFSVTVARNVFGAVDEKSALFTEGVEWGGLCFAMYNAVTFLFSFVLIALARRHSPRLIHFACLLCGGLSLVSVMFITNKYLLFLPMMGVGIAWASVVSMPYAMLSNCLPSEKYGVYMGIFNFFIVIPEILASLGLGLVMIHVFHGNRMAAVVTGGVYMLIAAVLVLRVRTGGAKGGLAPSTQAVRQSMS
ncbi:MAG: MFS transporter [Verrucomicrobiae bacterium]|nr:MFS transporter [Verrucomicrobiae bacterium]